MVKERDDERQDIDEGIGDRGDLADTEANQDQTGAETPRDDRSLEGGDQGSSSQPKEESVIEDDDESNDFGPRTEPDREIVEDTDLETERVMEGTEISDPLEAHGRETESGSNAGPGVRATEDDVGKDVLDAGGEKLGIVADVKADVVHVDPDPGITERIKAALGWGNLERDDTYAIQQRDIQSITDDALQLRQL